MVLPVVVVLVVVDAVVVLCEGVDFGTSGADGCCGAVHRGMKKL